MADHDLARSFEHRRQKYIPAQVPNISPANQVVSPARIALPDTGELLPGFEADDNQEPTLYYTVLTEPELVQASLLYPDGYPGREPEDVFDRPIVALLSEFQAYKNIEAKEYRKRHFMRSLIGGLPMWVGAETLEDNREQFLDRFSGRPLNTRGDNGFVRTIEGFGIGRVVNLSVYNLTRDPKAYSVYICTDGLIRMVGERRHKGQQRQSVTALPYEAEVKLAPKKNGNDLERLERTLVDYSLLKPKSGEVQLGYTGRRHAHDFRHDGPARRFFNSVYKWSTYVEEVSDGEGNKKWIETPRQKRREIISGKRHPDGSPVSEEKRDLGNGPHWKGY